MHRLFAFAACLALLLSVLVVGVVRIVRERLGVRHEEAATPLAYTWSVAREAATRRARVAHLVLMAVAALALLFAAGVMVWGDPRPLFGVSFGFNVVLALGVLAALLTVAALVGAVLAWKDGYWRLRPLAPAGRAPTAFGSSFLIGPVEVEGRPIVRIREVAFDPKSRTFTLSFARGGTATVTLAKVDRSRHQLDVAFDAAIVGRPFAALRTV